MEIMEIIDAWGLAGFEAKVKGDKGATNNRTIASARTQTSEIAHRGSRLPYSAKTKLLATI
jgi:hypothetical protein